MSLLFWALTFFLLDHGALNLGDGKVDENPENWLRRLAFPILWLHIGDETFCMAPHRGYQGATIGKNSSQAGFKLDSFNS